GPLPAENAFTSFRHGNGRDWWIIIPGEFRNICNLYLLTPDSLLGPFSQNYVDSIAAEFEKTGWNEVFSPDGTKFIRVTLSESFNRIFLYDFDRCSGLLSNAKVITVADQDVYASWAAISPNSRYLYFQIAQTKLYQFDFWASDIEATKQLIGEYDGFTITQGHSTAFHAMALAPNGKIYMCCTSGIYYYHTIHAPDEPGIACHFVQHDLELPAVPNNLMPNYPNFRLFDVEDSICDSLGIDTPVKVVDKVKTDRKEMIIAPNSSENSVHIQLNSPPENYLLRLYNLLGSLVYEQEGNSSESIFVSVETLAAGTYMMQVTEVNGKRHWTAKLQVKK
ncbi:MAG: T9SS type A sorting domain-containing protein, partial [Saprospiraceae bacterium]|nr:T9SS type A sorting domain-containing protein [Saprospiraceae bacterium]